MKRIITITLALICLFPLYIIIVSLLASRTAPLDDSDIHYSPKKIPDKTNGYVVIQPALKQIKESGHQDIDSTVNELKEKDTFDYVKAEKLLNRHSSILEVYSNALKLESFQIPVLQNSFAPEQETYSIQLMTVNKLAALNVKKLIHEDNVPEASEEIVNLLKYGYFIQHADGGLISFIVGSAVKRQALELLEVMVLRSNFESPYYQGMRNQVATYCNNTAIINTLKKEYTDLANTLRNLDQDMMYDLKPGSGILERYSNMAAKLRLGYFYNKTATLNQLADYYRKEINNVNGQYADIKHAHVSLPSSKVLLFIELLSGNPIGKIMLNIILPPFDRIVDRKLALDAQCNAALLSLAIKAYHAEHNLLPENLDHLTPYYISEIPHDPFGQKLAYSKSKKVVYSVGADMQDNGGDSEKDILFMSAK
jgi:hypothetical protein